MNKIYEDFVAKVGREISDEIQKQEGVIGFSITGIDPLVYEVEIPESFPIGLKIKIIRAMSQSKIQELKAKIEKALREGNHAEVKRLNTELSRLTESRRENFSKKSPKNERDDD